MPNWCNNTITISGQTETIKNLWEEATAEDGGLLSAMVPMPKELEGTTSPSPEGQTKVVDGYTNWYDWSVSRWGTKWDVSTEGLEFKDNGDGTAEITGWFDSAWAPPLGAYEKFCDDMDGVYLEAYYDETGMVFCGYWSNEGGDDYYEYGEATSETIRDIVPDYLVDEFALDERLAEWEEMEMEMED
jgi:hypothetical protein